MELTLCLSKICLKCFIAMEYSSWPLKCKKVKSVLFFLFLFCGLDLCIMPFFQLYVDGERTHDYIYLCVSSRKPVSGDPEK